MLLSRRELLKKSGALVLGPALLSLTACGESRSEQNAQQEAQSSANQASSPADTETSSSVSATENSASTAEANSKATDSAAQTAAAASSLVLYFSHTGENYGVGYIEEGNTAIIAKMIAEKTGSDSFELVPAQAYPEGYDECCDVALAEKNAGERPAYVGDIDISPYETIYVGYPIWWGDLPMCFYTFIEAHDWSGKTVRPFCTHAGSGLSGTVSSLQTACAGATVGEGLSIAGTTAQNSRDEAQAAVDGWL
ncbi:MAG: hypothetical protein IJ125_09495 [Atopobiaceae bacterium]|nr:hypothetical protein [Atopobiaceae bacterium]